MGREAKLNKKRRETGTVASEKNNYPNERERPLDALFPEIWSSLGEGDRVLLSRVTDQTRKQYGTLAQGQSGLDFIYQRFLLLRLRQKYEYDKKFRDDLSRSRHALVKLEELVVSFARQLGIKPEDAIKKDAEFEPLPFDEKDRQWLNDVEGFLERYLNPDPKIGISAHDIDKFVNGIVKKA